MKGKGLNMTAKTRLTLLIDAHDLDGGTIHQFNRAYGVDFLRMPSEDFQALLYCIQNDIGFKKKIGE